jgi:tetratricopeptide (TPR) repeat protein
MVTDVPSKRNLWLVLATLVVLLGLAPVGAYKYYRHVEPSRLSAKARVALDQADYNNAVILARRALQIDPTLQAASLIMAETAEKFHLSEALIWRKRIADFDPTTAHRLQLARSQFLFDRTQEARATLQEIAESNQSTVEFQDLAGTLAMRLKKFDEAATHYEAALKIDPKNNQFAFNRSLAILNIPARHVEARQEFDRLSADSKFRLNAQRVLIRDSIAHNDLPDALERSRKIESEGVIRDQLILCELLLRTHDPEFAGRLQALQKNVSGKPAETSTLISWMNDSGLSAGAVTWIETLPPETLAQPAIAAPLASCYVATKNWPGLIALVKDANWAGLDYLRLTFFARALLEQGDTNGFLARWNAAKSAAAKTPESLRRLYQVGSVWGWKGEVRDLLWMVAEDSKEPAWALSILYKYYDEKHDTRGLHRVFTRMADLEPDNDAVQNNYAMFALLLKSNVDRAFNIAHDLFEKHKTDPSFVSTYAYALYLQDRGDEGLKVLESLGQSQLEEPSTAAYYGILLASTGRVEQARKYLALAKTEEMLPEEVQLLTGAKQTTE